MNEKILAYYFGTLDEQERLEIEEQLLKSPAILMEFIAIKRSFEIDHSDGRRPSVAAAARLRREVEEKFSPRFSTKGYWYWLPPAVAAALFVISGGTLLYSKMAEKPRQQSFAQGQTNCAVDHSNGLASGLANGTPNNLVVNQVTNAKLAKGILKKASPTPMMAEAYGENSHPKDSR